MPELPEVETIRRQLAPLVEGRRLARVEVLDPRWSRPLAPEELADALMGRRVERLERRGKYLVWCLSDEVFLAQHLRMTGAVLCEPRPEPPHVSARFGAGGPERWWWPSPPAPGGRRPAPLWHRRAAARRGGAGGASSPRASGWSRWTSASPPPTCARSRGGAPLPIKAFLLDQRRVAGVGNIYADEALFRAGIHPLRPAGRLTGAQYARLRDAVVAVLLDGIDARGATIDDFRHVDGVRGSFQDRFLVHRRAGLPCPRCGRTIVKLVVAGRGTYVCERCQPRPRGVGGRALRRLAETGMLAEGQCLPASAVPAGGRSPGLPESR